MDRFRYVLALFVAPLLFGGLLELAYGADGEFGTVYVPKEEYRDIYIPTQLVMPASTASSRARASMWVLRNVLSDYVRPQQNEITGSSQCIVQLQQLEDTDPTYFMTCTSEVPSAIEPVVKYIGHFDDSAEVFKKFQEFSQEHFKRTRESILRRVRGPLQTT